MESITIKVEDDLAKEISKAMKPLYTTKTEFIREAIRNQIYEMQKQRALAALRRNFGAAKTQTSDEELERIREKVGNEVKKRRGLE